MSRRFDTIMTLLARCVCAGNSLTSRYQVLVPRRHDIFNLHRNGNIVFLTKFSSLVALEAGKMATSWDFQPTFPFQCFDWTGDWSVRHSPTGLGSIHFFQFNSNSSWIRDFSIQFNSNSNRIQNLSIQFQFDSWIYPSHVRQIYMILSYIHIPYRILSYCPACRTTLIATRFRVAVICPIIQVPHCIRVFFYFVWFVFINFHFYHFSIL